MFKCIAAHTASTTFKPFRSLFYTQTRSMFPMNDDTSASLTVCESELCKCPHIHQPCASVSVYSIYIRRVVYLLLFFLFSFFFVRRRLYCSEYKTYTGVLCFVLCCDVLCCVVLRCSHSQSTDGSTVVVYKIFQHINSIYFKMFIVDRFVQSVGRRWLFRLQNIVWPFVISISTLEETFYPEKK